MILPPLIKFTCHEKRGIQRFYFRWDCQTNYFIFNIGSYTAPLQTATATFSFDAYPNFSVPYYFYQLLICFFKSIDSKYAFFETGIIEIKISTIAAEDVIKQNLIIVGLVLSFIKKII